VTSLELEATVSVFVASLISFDAQAK